MLVPHWEKDGPGSTLGTGSPPFPPRAISEWAPTPRLRERIVTRMGRNRVAGSVSAANRAVPRRGLAQRPTIHDSVQILDQFVAKLEPTHPLAFIAEEIELAAIRRCR